MKKPAVLGKIDDLAGKAPGILGRDIEKHGNVPEDFGVGGAFREKRGDVFFRSYTDHN